MKPSDVKMLARLIVLGIAVMCFTMSGFFSWRVFTGATYPHAAPIQGSCVPPRYRVYPGSVYLDLNTCLTTPDTLAQVRNWYAAQGWSTTVYSKSLISPPTKWELGLLDIWISTTVVPRAGQNKATLIDFTTNYSLHFWQGTGRP